MYRGTHIDAMGRKRTNMGYYTLSKPNMNKADGRIIIVEARDKASAANKVNRKYKMAISPSQLREVPLTVGKLLMWNINPAWVDKERKYI